MNLGSPKYIVDTCSFTTLQRVYPIDVFPGVWDLLDKLAEKGVAGSVEDVLEELKYQDDFLLRWASKHKNIFIPLDKQIQTQAAVILSAFGHLVDLKKRKSGADPFIWGRNDKIKHCCDRRKTQWWSAQGQNTRCLQSLQCALYYNFGCTQSRGIKTKIKSYINIYTAMVIGACLQLISPQVLQVCSLHLILTATALTTAGPVEHYL